MKRFTSLIFAALFVIICQAQVEHLTFMGIPIDGKIKDFQKELKSKGFSRTSERSEGTRFYKGSFSGYNCKLLVRYNPNTNIVYSVGVCIPCGYRIISEQTYLNFKRDLIEKYETAKFDLYSDYYKDNNDLFKDAVETGKLTRINSSSSKNGINGRESTTINITKPIIHNLFGGESSGFALSYLFCKGNVGNIIISTEYDNNIESDYKDFVMIIYLDSQNVKPINEANKADL